MAGNYPDYPSYRMAYDRDGTQGYLVSASNVLTAMTLAQMQTLNDETDSNINLLGTNGTVSLLFMFPEARDLKGYFHNSVVGAFNPPTSCTVSVSTDTTNGIDGTWTTISSAVPPSMVTNPNYRTGIITANNAAIKAFKIRGSTGSGNQWSQASVHLFGEITAGQNPDRLILWHPTLDQRAAAAYFDWGDVRRSSAVTTKTFRVKNNSSTLTANGVGVSFDVLSDASPTLLAGQHALSLDGTTFTNTVTIGALAPGAISGTVTLRRTISATAALSVWALRLVSTATSWT
jgi:hypothetical protein